MTDEEVRFVATLFRELKKQINEINQAVAGIMLASKINTHRLDQIKPYADEEEKVEISKLVAEEMGRKIARVIIEAKQKAEDEKGPEYKEYINQDLSEL